MYVRRCTMTNFGDDLNMPLIKSISGKSPTAVNQSFGNPTNKIIYLVIGSVLQWADRNSIVWGTGYMSPNSRMREKPRKICAVRGRLTREQLFRQGFDCPETYGDPALLYPRFYMPVVDKKFKLGIMPHYIDQNVVTLNRFKNIPGVLFINARQTVNKVVDDINSCEKIVSSCLHGLIVADAYGIPSLWIKLSDKVLGNGFKFRDYFSSVGRRNDNPLILNNSISIESILRSFEEYRIQIDLDKLWQACPFRSEAT